MKNITIKNLYWTLCIILLIASGILIAQGSSNNSFVFNGQSSQLYVFDGSPANIDANQHGFQYFDTSASNNQITVQAWVYLIGDTPPNVQVPIIYRSVNNGTTFSLYLKNNVGYFSIGNLNVATVNTSKLPAFQWIALTGSYDGSTLKIYSGGTLISSTSFSMTTGYSVTNGTTGLFVGKSNTGAFKGLIDEIRIFNIALGDNNINGSGGNGNPAENIPSSILQYLVGEWSFTSISSGNILLDLSNYKNHLFVSNINQIVPSKSIPFFVVTSNADAHDALLGDGSAVSTNGQVTLRSAIEEANVDPGQQIIYFYIQGSPVIQPLSPLPSVTESLFVDGTTQSGYVSSPVVQINGTYGNLAITGGNSTLTGLAINSTAAFGLTLSNLGGNNISANQLSGISVGSNGNTISSNNITNLTGDGVAFTSGAGNNVLSNNIISAGTGNGISLTNANGNSITNNSISSNSLNGISVSGSTGIISNNNITGNHGIGMTFTNSSGNQITNNTIRANTLGGVSLSNCTETLRGDTISGNLGYGILLSSSNNKIFSNIVSGNSSHGIIVNGSNNAIDTNTVFGNGTSGIGQGVYVQSGNNNSILNNSIYNNSTLGIQLVSPANNSQSYPTLTTLYSWQDSTALPKIRGGSAIQGVLKSIAGKNYKIQFFANSSLTYREGKRFIGEITVTTDISGTSNFVANIKDAVLTSGEVVSATATQ